MNDEYSERLRIITEELEELQRLKEGKPLWELVEIEKKRLDLVIEAFDKADELKKEFRNGQNSSS
jgi:hypothetical protein